MVSADKPGTPYLMGPDVDKSRRHQPHGDPHGAFHPSGYRATHLTF